MSLVVPLVVVGVILLLVLLYIKAGIYVVKQAEGIAIERLGKFDRVLEPGLNWVWPFVEAPRRFTWRRTTMDINGKVIDETTTDYRVDLREACYSFVRQEVFCGDHVMLEVHALMFFSIADVRKAIYEVDDLDTSIQNTAQSQLKEAFGSLTFRQAMQSQKAVNQHMAQNFASRFERWGLRVFRTEIVDMVPKASTDTSFFMKKQMIAERHRRSEFIQAEGSKAAMRLQSEGTRLVKFNMGVAEQEATRKRSEGEADAKVKLAVAEKTAFNLLATTLQSDGCSQSAYMVTKAFVDLFSDLAVGASSKVLFLPYDISSISGIVNDLPKLFGRHAVARSASSGGGAGGGAGAGAGSGAGAGAGASSSASDDPFAALN